MLAIVDDEDFERLSKFKWYASSNGRYVHRWDGKNPVSLHHEVMGLGLFLMIDHKNHNGLDNRKENLRPCTHKENMRNRKKHRPRADKTSPAPRSLFKGVQFDWRKRYTKPWRARIQANGVVVRLGNHETAELAAEAYDRASLELHGEFGLTNRKLGLL